MSESKFVGLGLILVAAAITFVGYAIWRHTDFLYSQTPEAKAGQALLDQLSHDDHSR